MHPTIDTPLCTVNGCDQPRARQRTVCRPHSRKTYPIPCAHCGKTAMKDERRDRPQLCTYECRDAWLKAEGKGRFGKGVVMIPPPGYRRGPLRRAFEDGDCEAFLAIVRERSDVDARSGCWLWKGTLESGYPMVTMNGRVRRVHRLVVEIRHGKPLNRQAAHHACANTQCVNPDHLQPVTAAANSAEMMARTYMESRIRDLEQALQRLNPAHPLLAEVGLAPASQ